MVEYGLREHPETAKALEAGVPPILTKLGYLLFRSGFTSFKDWYFAEGWLEGNTKLQGEKQLNEEARKRQIKKLTLDIEDFLKRGKRIQELVPDAINIYKELLKRKNG